MRNKKAWIFWESRRKYSDYSVISLCVYGNPGYKWNFQYLAANQDAFASGDKLGISKDCCVNFEASGVGVARMCCAVAGFVDNIRKHK